MTRRGRKRPPMTLVVDLHDWLTQPYRRREALEVARRHADRGELVQIIANTRYGRAALATISASTRRTRIDKRQTQFDFADLPPEAAERIANGPAPDSAVDEIDRGEMSTKQQERKHQ